MIYQARLTDEGMYSLKQRRLRYNTIKKKIQVKVESRITVHARNQCSSDTQKWKMKLFSWG